MTYLATFGIADIAAVAHAAAAIIAAVAVYVCCSCYCCSCLEESLRLSPELLFKHLGDSRGGWTPWHQRLQQLSNKLRVSCGVQCAAMQHFFAGLSHVGPARLLKRMMLLLKLLLLLCGQAPPGPPTVAGAPLAAAAASTVWGGFGSAACRDLSCFWWLHQRQQQVVFSYLRQNLSLPDRLCINWIRHTDDVSSSTSSSSRCSSRSSSRSHSTRSSQRYAEGGSLLSLKGRHLAFSLQYMSLRSSSILLLLLLFVDRQSIGGVFHLSPTQTPRGFSLPSSPGPAPVSRQMQHKSHN